LFLLANPYDQNDLSSKRQDETRGHGADQGESPSFLTHKADHSRYDPSHDESLSAKDSLCQTGRPFAQPSTAGDWQAYKKDGNKYDNGNESGDY
jgi:hypothetical protein